MYIVNSIISMVKCGEFTIVWIQYIITINKLILVRTIQGEKIMEQMNQRGKYLLYAGIVCLVIAIVILFIIPDPSANNVEVVKKATNAMQAAQEISKNNQTSILMHTIGMALLGFGITASVGGFILKSMKKK